MPCSVEKTEFQGLPALRLHGPRGSTAIVSLFGGQLLSWVTHDGRERLYLSDQAVFDGETPIRGGVPICFPQFAGAGDLPKHGLLRQREWSLAGERAGDDYVLLTLEIFADETTEALWPYRFRAEITVMLEADRLDLEFCVENLDDAPFAFTGALHSYLRVTQVEDVALEGLYGHHYRDAVLGGEPIRETGTELRVDRETDRAYFGVSRPLLLQAGNFSLGIHSRGFADVVVWNPWEDRAVALTDLPDDGWRHFLCVEAAAVGEPVTVAPGEEWSGRQTLVVV